MSYMIAFGMALGLMTAALATMLHITHKEVRTIREILVAAAEAEMSDAEDREAPDDQHALYLANFGYNDPRSPLTILNPAFIVREWYMTPIGPMYMDKRVPYTNLFGHMKVLVENGVRFMVMPPEATEDIMTN